MATKKRTASKPKQQEGFSLAPLRDKLEKAGQLASWIEAAKEHASEFPSDVVQTVIADYLAQFDTLSDELGELADVATAEHQRLSDEAGELEDTSKAVEAQVDEFKLRHVIGELTQDEFEKRETEARSGFDGERLEAVRTSIGEIDGALAELGTVRARVTGVEPEPEPEPEPPAAEPEPEPAAEPVAFEEPPPAADELGEEAYQAGGGPQDEWDVEPPESVPETAESAPAVPDPPAWPEADQEPAAETAEAAAPASLPDPPAMAEGEDLMATGVIQAQPGIGDAPPPVQNTADIGGQVEAPPGDGPRLAVTPPDGEQVIYPFSGDVMSLGRGRNNDIQIKNDGKISRYHCRIFRRGDEFIVEDNKSSNGTLVDGKLVTRQRLEGGEIVQLGETRVQFFMS